MKKPAPDQGAGEAGAKTDNAHIEHPTSNAQDHLSPAVTNACRAITAFLTKLIHAKGKTEQYKRSIGQLIAAIKGARQDDWETIVKVECGLGRRSAYSYMAVADGTETVEGQRAKNRERVARHRNPAAFAAKLFAELTSLLHALDVDWGPNPHKVHLAVCRMRERLAQEIRARDLAIKRGVIQEIRTRLYE